MKKPKNSNIVTVDLANVEMLVEHGKDIFLTPEAEASIVALLDLQERIKEAVDRMKGMIAAAGEAHNPNFTSIKGDNVRIQYRQYGGKYAIDVTRVQELPTDLYDTKVSYSPKTKEIDKWTEEHGGLPLGINERERAKTVSITVKKTKI